MDGSLLFKGSLVAYWRVARAPAGLEEVADHPTNEVVWTELEGLERFVCDRGGLRARREPFHDTDSFEGVTVFCDHWILHELARDGARQVLRHRSRRHAKARELRAVVRELGFEGGRRFGLRVWDRLRLQLRRCSLVLDERRARQLLFPCLFRGTCILLRTDVSFRFLRLRRFLTRALDLPLPPLPGLCALVFVLGLLLGRLFAFE